VILKRAGDDLRSAGAVAIRQHDHRHVGEFALFRRTVILIRIGNPPARVHNHQAARQEFENYAQKFSAEGDTRISGTSIGRKTVKRNFVVDDAMVADFRTQLDADKVKIDEDAFRKDADFIRAMIRFRIDEVVFGIADARRHLIAVDPQAQAALTEFGEAQKLTQLAHASTKVGQ